MIRSRHSALARPLTTDVSAVTRRVAAGLRSCDGSSCARRRRGFRSVDSAQRQRPVSTLHPTDDGLVWSGDGMARDDAHREAVQLERQEHLRTTRCFVGVPLESGDRGRGVVSPSSAALARRLLGRAQLRYSRGVGCLRREGVSGVVGQGQAVTSPPSEQNADSCSSDAPDVAAQCRMAVIRPIC